MLPRKVPCRNALRRRRRCRIARRSPLAALAQADYPEQADQADLAVPGGGTSDVMARMLAEELGKQLKQPVLVENIGGAGGVIGTDRALKLPADGYTLIQTGVGQNAVAHGINPKVPYDSNKDFIHLTQVHSGPERAGGAPFAPFNTFQEFLAYGRANPGKLNYGYTPAAPATWRWSCSSRPAAPAWEQEGELQAALHGRHPLPRRRPDDDGPAWAARSP
jgi:tripartite-type tricarboxylate transporter receptor subunit TctC